MLLFAAIAGYFILERAQTHKTGVLKPVGQFVGWFAILYGVAGSLVLLQSGGYHAGKRGMGKWMMCPWGGHGSQGPSSAAPAQ